MRLSVLKAFLKFWSNLTGKNTKYLPPEVIRDQIREKRPLPIGRAEWDAFVERIFSGLCIPGVTKESIAFALADQILHLGPTEDFKEDAFFIHALRKFAVNQTADEMRKEIRDAAKYRLATEEAEKAKASNVVQLTSEVTPSKKGENNAEENTPA